MAGGQWRMQVPASAGAGGVSGKQAFRIDFRPGNQLSPPIGPSGSGVPTSSNLLRPDGPTLLTQWALESIYIPIVIASDVAIGQSVSLSIQLMLNDQLVWQTAQQAALAYTVAAGGLITPMNATNAVISENFNNPITVKRCDVLRFTATGSVDNVGATNIQAYLGVTVRALAAGGNGLYDTPGTIGYEVFEIPGRRRL